MATHSSILAWKIPQTEEPVGLQSMGLQESWIQLSNHTTTQPDSRVYHTLLLPSLVQV